MHILRPDWHNNERKVKIIETLVSMGADLELKDDQGLTALDIAQASKGFVASRIGITSLTQIDLDCYDKIIDILQHPKRLRRLGGIRLPFSMPKK